MFKHRIVLGISIFLLAVILRIVGLDWDKGYHFHPDERMLIMVTDRIHLFSQLNPDFFNYGSLPVYILRGVSQLIDYIFSAHTANYDGLLYVGRWISTILDILVMILIYRIGQLLFKDNRPALWSAFFYAISFFPIQNSHFFVVDVFLNFFSTLIIYLLIRYHEDPTWKKIILLGIVYAAALTTKVSAIIFSPIILLVISISHTRRLYWWKQLLSRIMAVVYHKHDTDIYTYRRTIILKMLAFAFVTGVCSFVFMPYAFLQYQRFLNDILLQTKMNSDPYIFPYTLQYVGTTPYWYYLRNIFLWGAGPIISILAIIGIIDLAIRFFHQLKEKCASVPTTFKKFLHVVNIFLDNNMVIVLLFYILYFVIIGQSAVKFMRYMLLIYPFIALLAGAGAMLLQEIHIPLRSKKIFIPILPALIFVAILWTLAFVSIYMRDNTRIRATEWINQYIPAGSVIAVEHWDDRVPIFDPGKYQYVELTLYDQPDNEMKWQLMNQKLESAEYMVIASNRLYVPLQKLSDCSRFRSCYPYTSRYYEELFAGKRGFTKIIEFTSYPELSIGGINMTINDDSADESFTVYDHPKIIVFKKDKR